MMAPANAMHAQRLGSSVLLAGGIVFVFAGLSSALGFSSAGMVASVAAIAALLYAGGVWFGESRRADSSAVLFTPALTIASGPLGGRRVSELFPDALRREIETRCREAIDGRGGRFACGSGADRQSFAATPVRTPEGLVVYGLLLSGPLAAEFRAEQLTPVA